MTAKFSITILGAGITGLWQALVLARAGHAVQLIERSPQSAPFSATASRYAGAMLAPDCEAEAAPALVRELGHAALPLWRAVYPGIQTRGTLVVAPPREPGELARYARATQAHTRIDASALAALEPELAARFDTALYFPNEAHMAATDAMDFLLKAAIGAGARVSFGSQEPSPPSSSLLIDCRGLGAIADLPALRGVRGERVLVHAPEVNLTRPIRLLHPRVPLYVVPWPDQVYMIGATVIESADTGPMTVRSALELLGAASLLHAGFAEAGILDLGAGVRPALPDNIPRVIVEAGGRALRANGAYRHGFLLAPILAEATLAYLDAAPDHPLLQRTLG
jgi:glycine oxidase